MGFYHVENSFYFGGGRPGYHTNYDHISNFRKILPNGQLTKIQKMPTGKWYFAMTQWRERGILFTLGGYNGNRLK